MSNVRVHPTLSNYFVNATWKTSKFLYLFSIFETLDGGHDGPASPDGATPRDGLKVNSKAFRPEDAKQIQIFFLPKE